MLWRHVPWTVAPCTMVVGDKLDAGYAVCNAVESAIFHLLVKIHMKRKLPLLLSYKTMSTVCMYCAHMYRG